MQEYGLYMRCGHLRMMKMPWAGCYSCVIVVEQEKSQLKQRPHSTIGFFGMEDENFSEEGQRSSMAEESDL